MSTAMFLAERPPARHRTQETPAAIAREIALSATAPVLDFKAVLANEDRDKLWQRLERRVTANYPEAWSKTKIDDVEEQLSASLPADLDRSLFVQLVNHYADRATIREEAAFLVGREIGRRVEATPEPASITDDTVPPTAPDDNDTLEAVSEVMIRLVSALWLAKSVVDCQIGKDADVHEHGWWALTELLGSAATDLDAAHDRYCTESNALAAAAESGGAR